MKKHHKEAYVIPPHWEALVLIGVATVITGIMWFAGITSERAGHAAPRDLCILSIVCIILNWKSIRLSPSCVEVYRCSILCRRIKWMHIERVELLYEAGNNKHLLIELNSCPPCPKKRVSHWTYLYLWKHPRRLIKIKLKPDGDEEQIKMIEMFHPIDTTVYW